MMKKALITGANRGIGLEFVKQLKKMEYEVLASCRFPEKADKLKVLLPEENIYKLDVASQESINDAYANISRNVDKLHVIINNAGVIGNKDGLQNISFEDCINTFAVNALGPLFVTKAILPLIERGSKIMNITSLMGSIGDNGSGGYYSYRISKAALNMVTKNLQNDLTKRDITVISMHPGWVRTRMGGLIAPISRKKSVNGMLNVLNEITINDSGSYLNYKGETLPW